MKKFMVLLLALAMVFAFAACGEEAEQGGEVAGNEEVAGGEEEVTGLTVDTIKVGHVHINDEAEQGYSTAHINGVKAACEALGIPEENVIGKYNIAEDSSCETACRELVEAGCNIIFCDSFAFEDWMLTVAAEYPEVYFCHATGYQCSGSGLDNVSNYFGNVFDARYLSGIVAGMTTESNKLGYVTAMQLPECISGFSAFYLGALSVNPDVTMDIMYTNSWYDPTLESQAAQALIDRGCDVLGQHADSTTTQTTAEAAGIYSVGYNMDMSGAAPQANICSVVWDWTPTYQFFLEEVLSGKAYAEIPTDYSGTLADGMVDVVYNEELLGTFANAEDIKAAVEAAREAINSGDLHVFAGPLFDAEGNEVVAEGDFYNESGEASAPSWNTILQGVTVVE